MVVISNRPDAAGLERARRSAIEAIVVDIVDGTTRRLRVQFSESLTKRDVRVVLSGRLRAGLVAAAARRVPMRFGIFIFATAGLARGRRPSIRPLNIGVKVSGRTVHFVMSDEFDGGPIILQRAVPVLDDDTRDEQYDESSKKV